MTTKRLSEARSAGMERNKRKKDVASTDVNQLIRKRANRYELFATEIARLDPQFTTVLRSYAVNDKGEHTREGFSFPASLTMLTNYLKGRTIYKEFAVLPPPLFESPSGPSKEREFPKTPAEPSNAVSAEVHKLRGELGEDDPISLILYSNHLLGYFLSAKEVRDFVSGLKNVLTSSAYKKLKNDSQRKSYLEEQAISVRTRIGSAREH